MMRNPVDVIILGQGIAGTTLAWRLLSAGCSVMVLDRGDRMTASKIAAGLMTPITGKRFAISWDWEDFYSEASQFYREVESKTGTHFFDELSMLRLFQTAEERQTFEGKLSRLTGLVSSTHPDFKTFQHAAAEGGFEMIGGRLHVEEYLKASRKMFQSMDSYIECSIDVQAEIEIQPNKIVIPKLNLTGKQFVSCQGFQSTMLPYFDSVKFNPAKGEILDIKTRNSNIDRVVHRGIWMSPRGKQLRIGATYDWSDLSTNVTENGRHWLTCRLNKLLPSEYEIVQHQAAIRPTMKDFHPVLGAHPKLNNVRIFNGLGSKGALMAPRLAQMLTNQLLHQTPLPLNLSVERWFQEES
ncbi:NAD(P)/FAD-dependent oxidoreductase [Thalassoglobus polymorphus]|uniref:Bifunctional tRNA (Mnm(5)s(2)U34)-methyltransferase/FAD-dependent cmnm(5)s(2)U34 oxidoreductase n=1 Tax=Thalassoglobus polymorphus TaxID=2527994 RepID=A0A517QT23_9PLAN|nr:FAD-dependent oxidoreductase [Thalassoglobus polymorphus]QDT34783.1 bifunctional tRNA (mnm(5)s(2)U34)-methyltransferase/FAD-dependent cmnm(5)s(2)U34 oxidoreductase [Thalassoglobus polymorphus]